jgi:ATPase
MEIIPRPKYMDRIVSRLDRGMMLILVGQRRVGKSYLLRQVKKWIEDNIENANLVYINKELNVFKKLTTADELYDYASVRLPLGGRNYLLIDEVQDIDKYENALRSFHAEERCQIVATGSNAYIFSTELSTRLSGRYIEIPVYNLSYREFLEFHGLEDSDRSLHDFLKVGGLPALRNFDIHDEGQLRDYLQGVYSTIMYKDVIAREEIRNIPFIENLACFIADNIGKLISIRNIANVMTSQGEKATAPSTSAYLKFLCNALLVNAVFRYDIHGKKLFEQNYKYYFSDHGIRNLLCGFNTRGSIEKIMENVIYLHLLQQGFVVRVGILYNGEIDFVATRGNTTLYFQATYLLASDETIRREFGNLFKIPNNYPKYVVSMDPISGELPEYPGIHHLNLREFLLTEL